MSHSLFYKLLGAFALVIAVLGAVVVVLARQATEEQFRSYSDASGQLLAQQLAPALSDYYVRAGTWEGVSSVVSNPASSLGASGNALPEPSTAPSGSLLPTATSTPQPTATLIPTVTESPIALPGTMGGMGGMRGMPRGTGRGGSAVPPGQAYTPAPGSGAAEGSNQTGMMGGMQGVPRTQTGMGNREAATHAAGMNWWAMTGQRVVVADANGRVVSDSGGTLQDKVLPTQQLAAGAPINVGEQRAGTVLVSAAKPEPASPAGQYLAAINRSILLALAAASAVALGMGAVLFYSITVPLRRLQAASNAIAAGDLSRRVRITSRDEIGSLAGSFNSMAESLARAEAQRKQMIADLAHELRTPLSVMQGNLEAIQDGILPMDGEQVASLHEETLLLGRLVADLRLLSLAEAGQLKLERVEVDLAEVVRRAVERMQQVAQERGVTLTVSAPEDLPRASLDGDRINQVVGNLVSNSLRHTPAGGSVQVAVDAVAGSKTVGDRNAGAASLVTVTDSGSGIPADELQSVFERFYRSDRSRSRSSGGSGLGLAIVKQIVELHGGQVWAESPVTRTEQGEPCGTRVSFTLPLTGPIDQGSAR